MAVSQVRTGPTDIRFRLESAAEAREIAQRLGNSMFRTEAAAALAGNLLEAGEMGKLKDAVSELEDLLKEMAFPWAVFGVTLLNGTIALTEGRLKDAEDLAQKAQELGRFPSGPDFDGLYGLQMFGIRREQGRLAEVAPVLQAVFQLGGEAHPWRPGLVALYAELGMVEEARAEIHSVVTPDGVLLPADSRRSLSLSYLADGATFLGDRRAAEVLYGELLPYAHVCVVTFNSTCYGPVSRYLGMLATTFGAYDQAQAHFEDALVRCDRLGSPTWVAHTQYQFARLLLARRRRDDVAQAGLLARAAQETAARVGMRALEKRIGRVLESGVEWPDNAKASPK
jgi:tetratricopeptide (TPR) repeat protein